MKLESLGILLERALWTMTGVLNTRLKQHGIDLPHSQYSVMRVLFDEDGISQAEIAARLHKDAAAIKRSIDNLESKGLIVRKPASLCKYCIHLSETGRNMQPEIMRIAALSMEEILKDFSANDVSTLADLLTRIHTSNMKQDEKAKRQRD